MLRLEVEGIPPYGTLFVLDDGPDVACGQEATVKLTDLGVQIPCLVETITPYPDGTVAVSLKPLHPQDSLLAPSSS